MFYLHQYPYINNTVFETNNAKPNFSTETYYFHGITICLRVYPIVNTLYAQIGRKTEWPCGLGKIFNSEKSKIQN